MIYVFLSYSLNYYKLITINKIKAYFSRDDSVNKYNNTNIKLILSV